jgi:hypothetical protein
MKTKIMTLIPVLFIVAVGCAGVRTATEFSGIQSFKNVRWGMTRDKAEVLMDRDLKKSGSMTYYMGDVMFGMPCKVTFDFGLKNSLRSITVEFDVMNPDAEYDYVIKKVTEAYGEAKKNSRDSGVMWDTPDTVISLMLTGGEDRQMRLAFVMIEKT